MTEPKNPTLAQLIARMELGRDAAKRLGAVVPAEGELFTKLASSYASPEDDPASVVAFAQRLEEYAPYIASHALPADVAGDELRSFARETIAIYAAPPEPRAHAHQYAAAYEVLSKEETRKVATAYAAFAKDKQHAPRLATELRAHVATLLERIEAAETMQGVAANSPMMRALVRSPSASPDPKKTPPPAHEAMHPWDHELVVLLWSIGAEGRRAAKDFGALAAERWASRDKQPARALWSRWLYDVPALNDDAFESDAMLKKRGYTPSAIRNLAQVLWRDRVGPDLEQEERERKTARMPVRLPTEVSKVLAVARATGGLDVGGAHILVRPPSGMALTLPFDEGLKVRRASGDMVNIRQALSPSALRTYLATLVLYHDGGMPDDGSFQIEGPATILGVTGATKHTERRGERTIQRYATKDTKLVLEHLALFAKIRVRVVGSLEAAAGDALLDEHRDRRNGRVAFYAHSRLIAQAVKTAYVQIPRAVCRLAPVDVPWGMGIATVAREKATALLRDGKPMTLPLEQWLAACGVDGREGARKQGRAYWGDAAETLARVAEEGQLGQMKIAAKGRDAVLTLNLSADLRSSYKQLVERGGDHAKAKAKATHAAMVLDARKR